MFWELEGRTKLMKRELDAGAQVDDNDDEICCWGELVVFKIVNVVMLFDAVAVAEGKSITLSPFCIFSTSKNMN